MFSVLRVGATSVARPSVVGALSIAVSGALAPLSASAAESDYFWQTAFGMGISVAYVTSGTGNRLTVNCATGAPSGTNIYFELNGQRAPGNTVYLDFGYGPEGIHAPDGEISTDYRLGMQNYDWVVERLKRHSSVQVTFENGVSAVFSLQGSSAAIGREGCTPDLFNPYQ